MSEEFASRRWRKLLNLIDKLPRTSFFIEARMQDEELAEQYLAHADHTNEKQLQLPSIVEYDSVTERLDTLAFKVDQLIAATVAAAGGKPGRVTPPPRPITAIERLRAQNRRQNAHRLRTQLLASGQ